MEALSWVVLAVSWLAALLFLQKLTTSLRQHHPLKFPPGPRPWPIIGNLNLIGPLPHQSLQKLAQKYGPIMQLRFGSFPVVVASSAEMAKHFLKTHDHVFASRPQTAAGKHTTYNYLNITWAPYGPYWRQGRKIYLSELFSSKRLESYEYIRAEELRAFVSRLQASSGKPIMLKEHLSRVTLSIISRIVLGRKYFSESESETENSIVTLEEFQEMLDELFLLNGVLNIGDWIPWLDFLDLQGYVKRMKALKKKFDRFHDHVFDEHKAKIKGMGDFVPRDMADLLLQLADDPNLQVKLNYDSVKGFTQETMRKHPVAVLLAPHLALEDCNVAGYDIRKGTRVFINSWSIGRDPSIWDEPEEFRPERFLQEKANNIDVKGHSFELLPFGSGRRMCPGYSLGLKMISSSLANLLHGFHWKLPGDGDMKVDDISMDEVYGLATPRKYPLVAVIDPRLPLHLY
ncbi:hypothetical protein JRO89_XS04G0194000 [Xanthoceras sorbifolium]|uniref:Flavonoid 3'-monooxygenase-like n=1 Tax=Xanthoceras sorbifolium TaxID=99658 RepID=A0ABQ8I6T2_9ROSI|nr:hypothetical protein JRO89_XS04G0194000 [Xanthoceras sorbifolium]